MAMFRNTFCALKCFAFVSALFHKRLALIINKYPTNRNRKGNNGIIHKILSVGIHPFQLKSITGRLWLTTQKGLKELIIKYYIDNLQKT